MGFWNDLYEGVEGAVDYIAEAKYMDRDPGEVVAAIVEYTAQKAVEEKKAAEDLALETEEFHQTKGAAKRAERFNQQCFLMDHWRKYAVVKPGGYKGFTCIDASPTEVIQQLTSGRGREQFMEITSAQAALLTPKIKLFKVPLKSNGKPESGLGEEIIFRTHYDEATISDMTANRVIRGDAVGLKELDYELYDAGSKETAAQRQKITIKFFAESLEALDKKTSGKASPLDLVHYSKNRNKTASETYVLKVVYGWAIPPASQELIPPGIRKALVASVQTLMLTLTEHSISWNENGSVELELEYEGYIDSKLSEVQRNILWPTPHVGENLDNLEEQIESLEEFIKDSDAEIKKATEEADKDKWYQWGSEADKALIRQKNILERRQETIGIRKERMALMQKIDKTHKYSRVLDVLKKSDKIRYVEVSKGLLGMIRDKTRSNMNETRPGAITQAERDKMTVRELAEYDERRRKNSAQQAPPVQSVGASGDALGDASDQISNTEMEKETEDKGKEYTEFLDDATTTTAVRGDDSKVRVNFMYFGDILTVILKASPANKKAAIRFLVGPLMFKDPETNKPYYLNLADIPISLPLFAEFWIKNVVSPGRETFTIQQFINLAVKELIVAALGDGCFEGAASNRPTDVSFTTLAAMGKQGAKDPFGKGPRLSNAFIKKMNPTPTDDGDIKGQPQFAKPKSHYEYMFIYCNAWSLRDLRGSKQRDLKRGIYHVAIGQDRGPIKKVSFEKSDIPYQRTAAIMGQGTDHPSSVDRLAVSYKANVTMMGNSLFLPGNAVYISPTSMGMPTDLAHRVGLGGYYTITKLNGRVDSTGWTSEIQCLPYNTSGEKVGPAPTQPAETPKEEAAAENGASPETS